MTLRPELRKALLDMDPKAVRNDIGGRMQHVVGKLLIGGAELTYGDMKVIVEQRALDEARDLIAVGSVQRRRQLQASVDAALRKAYPKIQRGRFSKKVADRFYADLVLWTALKETDA